jgi:hypothetical protein
MLAKEWNMRLRNLLPAFLVTTGVCAGPLVAQQAQFAPPVRLKAGDELIDTANYTAHAGPLVTDFDADGKPDLLVGNFAGHIQVYKNVGTRAEPVYEDKGLLEVNGEPAKVPNW